MNISFSANFFLQKTTILILLISALCCNYLNAGAGRFRIMFGNNPSTEMTIGFDAKYVGSQPMLYYSTSPIDVNNLQNYSMQQPNKVVNYHDMVNCFVRLTNLLPGRTYYFAVKDNFGISKVYNFETIPDTNTVPLSIIAGGDSRSDTTMRAIANKIVSKLNAHALMFNGDFVAYGHNKIQWQRWLDDWQLTISSNNRITPVIPSRGNHENNDDMLINLFDCPKNIVYNRTLGNNLIDIYTLNSERSVNYASTQTAWLENELLASNSIWKFVQYHKPIRPHYYTKKEGSMQYAYWANLFYKFGVDAVLEGDSHLNKTTWPIIPCSGGFGCDEGFIRDDNNGTVYLGEGSYASPLRAVDDKKTWTRESGSFQQFKWIFVDKQKMEVRTVKYATITDTDAINELNIENRFTIPQNIEIWNSPNGAVVTLEKSTPEVPVCTITEPAENQMYFSLDSINLLADATGTSAIAQVQFYVDGTLTDTDFMAPYQSSWVPQSNGIYIISAIAQDVNGMSSNLDFSVIKVGEKDNIVHTSTIDIGSDECIEYVKRNIAGTSQFVQGYVSFDESKIRICEPGVSMQFLRFNGINIPPYAIIDTAYIQFNPKSGGNAASATIWGEYSANSLSCLSTPFNVTDRMKTTNAVTWHNMPAWNASTTKAEATSPDLKTLVQELIQHPDWHIESPVTFLINGIGNRDASSFMSAQNSTVAPTLMVRFSIPAGCTNPEACNYDAAATVDDGSCLLPGLTCSTCLPPAAENITLYPRGTVVGVRWEVIPNSKYIFHYKAIEDAAFRTYTTPSPYVILFGLNDCTTYEFAISTICETGEISAQSELISYATTQCKKARENITISSERLVVVYPNPASDYLQIELTGSYEADLINIYDTTGKLVIAQNEITYDGTAYSANIKHLTQGVYFVKMVEDNFTTTKKFVVRH